MEASTCDKSDRQVIVKGNCCENLRYNVDEDHLAYDTSFEISGPVISGSSVVSDEILSTIQSSKLCFDTRPPPLRVTERLSLIQVYVI